MCLSDLRFVYCIGSDPGQPVKIGFTADPISRLSGIQAHNWQDMTLFWAVFGTSEDERKLLNTSTRIRGEWVEDPDGLIAGMFTTDILQGHFVSAMAGAMARNGVVTHWTNNFEITNKRDESALARAITLPKVLRAPLAEFCKNFGNEVPNMPETPRRDFASPYLVEQTTSAA